MHTRSNVVAVVTLCSLFATAWLLPEAAASERAREPVRPLAEMEISASRVDWQPAGDYERLVLTIAGPKDLYIRQEFGAGQLPSLGLFDSSGNPLPDGNYTYELWIMPRQKPEAGLLLRHSGHLAVRGGSFVTMDSPESVGPVSRAPLKRITAEQIISEGVCIGDLCTTGDEGSPLRLKDEFSQLIIDGDTPNIFFKDDTSGGFSADHSWYLVANELFNSAEFFALVDAETHNKVLTVEGDAPDASLYVRSNGNIGLGTSTPAVRLDVRSSAAAQATERLQNSSATGYPGTEYLDNAGNVSLYFGLDNAASTTRLNSINNKPIVVLTNSTERMRVTSGGSVGIGTTSPEHPFEVARSGAVEMAIENTSGTPVKWFFQVDNDANKTLKISKEGTGGAEIIVDQRLDANGATFKVDGSVQATNVVFSSSRELKERIQPLDSQEILARLARLSISEWSFKEGPQETRHIGPMAEDFNALFGTSRDTTTISVTDTSGVALAAIQALLQRIEDLETRNTELAERLHALETREAD